MKKVLITGINGLIGTELKNYLIEKKFEVFGLVRNKEKVLVSDSSVELFEWSDDENKLIQLMKEVDVIVHLAGKSIAEGRWNEKVKTEIYESRIKTTERIATLILKSNKKHELFLSASAVGYYGMEINKISNEESEPGNDFLSKTCIDWENASSLIDTKGIRRVNLRIGTVLSTNGGALQKLLTPFKIFGGAILGSGKQYFPWIHIKDLTRMIHFIIDNNRISGPINAVSPYQVTMREFCKTLSKMLNRPCLVRVPEWLVRLIIGEMSTLLVSGGQVIPKRIIEFGFQFNFENLESALEDLLKRESNRYS